MISVDGASLCFMPSNLPHDLSGEGCEQEGKELLVLSQPCKIDRIVFWVSSEPDLVVIFFTGVGVVEIAREIGSTDNSKNLSMPKIKIVTTKFLGDGMVERGGGG